MIFKEVVIIGGGAAGFFAAANCNTDGEILLLEKTSKLLSKVRVSGGGRCNVTHACFENNEFVKNYPRGEKVLKGPFSQFNSSHTVEWFEKRGVELKAEADGRMFPVTNNSETIINCLLNEVKKNNVEIKINASVENIVVEENKFIISLINGDKITADKLLIAAGGHPKTEGYNWLKNLGHSIITPVPSLFTFNIPDKVLTQLMGVSVSDATVKISGTKLMQSGPLLITHWGLSGPAILKTSAWSARVLADMNYDFNAIVSWVSGYNEETIKQKLLDHKENYKSSSINIKPFDQVSKRLWEYLLLRSEIPGSLRWADISTVNINKLSQTLVADVYPVKGKTTFKEEFVTCGGINLNEIDFKTMQSKKQENLYFAGEVLDIDGVTGGFNFQSAWTTAWIAAKSMSK